MPKTFDVVGAERTTRIVVDDISGGLSTRSFPHLIADNELAIADNVVFTRDGIASKRPGNVNYGGGNGATGSGSAILAMTRFYAGTPVAGSLIVHSGANLYKGTDGTGAFAQIMNGLSAAQGANFAQCYDPDADAGAGAVVLVVCDGARIPQLWDGAATSAVKTGSAGGVNYLPVGRTGNPITPAYLCNWGPYLVYAGEPTEPSAIYISDALRPERFNGYGLEDSAGTQYTPYFPAGRNTDLGIITGLAVVGGVLLIFYTSGIVACTNTGTYGAFEFEFSRLACAAGCVAPRSIAIFEWFVVFFGGDKFYATDGLTVVPLPDRVPSIYSSTNTAIYPPEMKTKNSVVGVRRSQQYWASYDVTGNGVPTAVAVFDFRANGGWQYGAQSGGAWSRWPTGMAVSAAIECRGPGDNDQLFWGSSQADLVAQHDTGVYADFGESIPCEVRAKSFFLDRPIWPKTIQAVYPLLLYPAEGNEYTGIVTPYVAMDQQLDFSPPVNVDVQEAGGVYGVKDYGAFNYGSAQNIVTGVPKGYPAQPALGYSVAPGCTESSSNPFNCIGFVCEVTIDEPAP